MKLRIGLPVLFSGVSGGGDESEDGVQQRPPVRLRGRRRVPRAVEAPANRFRVRQEEGLLHARRQGASASASAARQGTSGGGSGTDGGPEAGGGGGGGAGGAVSGREGGAAVLAALPGDGTAPRGAVHVLVTYLCMHRKSLGRICAFSIRANARNQMVLWGVGGARSARTFEATSEGISYSNGQSFKTQ